MTEQMRTARLVKKVVVGYMLPSLPPFLMRSFILLRSKLARAGFRVEVVLRPIIQLPPDTDLLFVPVELVQTARQAVPEVQVVPLTARTAQQPAYEVLLKQLQAGQELYALRVEVGEDPSGSRGGSIVRYRGYTRIS